MIQDLYKSPDNKNALFKQIIQYIGNEGLVNGHAHLDRSGTNNTESFAHVGFDPLEATRLTLREKQNLTGKLHLGIAYDKENFRDRLRYYLDESINYGIVKVESLIDTSADSVGISMLEVAREIKGEYKGQIDFRFAAYPIFGFKDSHPDRWKVFEEGANIADFLGLLPERDDTNRRGQEAHIGRDEHFRRTIDLAERLNIPAHFHTGQENDPRETITEDLIQALRWKVGTKYNDREEPKYWAVHVISPSAFEEERFQKVVQGFADYNIGLVVCPTAAIGMRQKRSVYAPVHNSIARALEFMAAGVHVKLGTDNIDDPFIPNGTPNIFTELDKFMDGVRIYDAEVLAQVAMGKRLTPKQIEKVRIHLENEAEKAKND